MHGARGGVLNSRKRYIWFEIPALRHPRYCVRAGDPERKGVGVGQKLNDREIFRMGTVPCMITRWRDLWRDQDRKVSLDSGCLHQGTEDCRALGTSPLNPYSIPPGTVSILDGNTFDWQKLNLQEAREMGGRAPPPCSGKGEITIRITGVCKSAVTTNVPFGKFFLLARFGERRPIIFLQESVDKFDWDDV